MNTTVDIPVKNTTVDIPVMNMPPPPPQQSFPPVIPQGLSNPLPPPPPMMMSALPDYCPPTEEPSPEAHEKEAPQPSEDQSVPAPDGSNPAENDKGEKKENGGDSEELRLCIKGYSDFAGISESVKSITTADDICNAGDGFEFVLEHFHLLESVIVGNHSFNKAIRFSISSIPSVKRIRIGEGSFNFNPSDGGKTILSFEVMNCNYLESISISKQSFIYFNSFNLDTCCSLGSLTIGQVNLESNNFTYADFIPGCGLRGLHTISVGDGCFSKGTRCILNGLDMFLFLWIRFERD